MTPKLENRKSRLVAGNVTPAKAGLHEVVDSRLRGLTCWAVLEFRISSFDSIF
jgi:hypothetical protein